MLLQHARRDRNFNGASENKGKFADYRAQFQMSFGMWLKIQGKEIIKGRESTKAPHYGYDDSDDGQTTGQDRTRNR